jgi:hypothetical protein
MIALQDHFRAFAYSTTLSPRGADPIGQFLDERVGFCQQFSGTFALMARALGAPARVAVGFTWGDPVPGEEGLYVVSGRQAHAWPEVWFPELGWVAFEPTPGRGAPDSTHSLVAASQDSLVQPDRPGEPTTTTAAAGAGANGPELSFDPGLGLPELGPTTPAAQQSGNSVPVWLIATAFMTMAYLIAVPLWHRLRRARRVHRATSPEARIDAAWADATEAIEIATGMLRPPGTTRTTWARQLRNDRRVPGEDLQQLADLVTRVRFDPQHHVSDDDVARAEAAASEVSRAVYDRLGRSQRWSAELDPRRLLHPTRRPLART